MIVFVELGQLVLLIKLLAATFALELGLLVVPGVMAQLALRVKRLANTRTSVRSGFPCARSKLTALLKKLPLRVHWVHVPHLVAVRHNVVSQRRQIFRQIGFARMFAFFCVVPDRSSFERSADRVGNEQ